MRPLFLIFSSKEFGKSYLGFDFFFGGSGEWDI
uniref:Uncharacterized protein n=1 Tax=Rhizophora mucronata TaxID=61149 RepID=A0A2P2J208_RHIMU